MPEGVGMILREDEAGAPVAVVSLPGRRAGLQFVEALLTRHSKDRELSGLGAYVALR